MYQRLVFLFFKCNVKRTHNIPSTATLFITKNEGIKQYTKKMGDAYSVDDLLNQKENFILRTRARDIMKAWADSHYTNYSGVSLGDLFISFYDIFVPYLKHIYVLEKTVEKYRPSEVIAVGSDLTLFRLFKTICERAGTSFKIIYQPFDEAGEILSDYFEMGGVSNIRSLFYHRKGDVSNGDKAKPIFSPLVFEFSNLLLGRIKNLIPVFLMERTLSLIVNILRPDYYSIKGKDKPHKNKVNVLSLCSFKNSVTTLSSLVNTLNDVGMTATCLVTHPDGLLECKAQKVPYIMVGEYYNDDLRKKIREDVKKVRASWWSNVHDEKFRALFTYNGVELFDLVRPSLFLIYMVGFEYAVTLLNLFEEAFRDLDPEALLLGDDVGFAGRAFVRGAKNRVPSLNVQHGTFADIIRYGEVVSTKMAVWGEYSRKELIDYGVDPKKIVVTGMPRINMILEHVKNTKFDPVKAFKGKQIVLWTPACYTDLDSFEKINKRILNSLCTIFKENGLSSAYKIVVKIHPLDSKDLYLNLLKKIDGVDITVIQNEHNVYDLINHCKLLLTTISTTGLEAIVLDKPLAVINMWGLEETIPYVKSGAGLLIRNENELTDLLVHLEDLDLETSLDEGRRRFKEIYLYKIDGLYNQRIVDAIKKL